MDRLARSIIAAQGGDYECGVTNGTVRCVIMKGHREKVHVGIVEGSPAYFQANGEPPKVEAIRSSGWPI